MTSKPCIVLFGDSLTQRSQELATRGWAAQLADAYNPRADIIVRGYSGYNTNLTLKLVAEQRTGRVLDRCSIAHHSPSLLVVFFGANDAALPHSVQHVPLERFTANLNELLDSLSPLLQLPAERIMLVTPPALDQDAWHQSVRATANDDSLPRDRDADTTCAYAAEVLRVARERHLAFLDLHGAMLAHDDWRSLLSDGLHFSPLGNDLMARELLRAIKEQVPSMAPSALPFGSVYWRDCLK